MTSTPFDTLAAVRNLENADTSRDHAEAVATEIRTGQRNQAEAPAKAVHRAAPPTMRRSPRWRTSSALKPGYTAP